MNSIDLTRAARRAAAQIDALQACLEVAGPVEAMILMPLIAQAVSILNTLEQLRAALKE
jgi:hypothetical protein